MDLKDFALEALKMVVPLGLAYVGLLKTRTDLDILYAKHRGCDKTKMRRKWYHRFASKRKEWDDVASLSSSVAVENRGPDGSGAVPEERED